MYTTIPHLLYQYFIAQSLDPVIGESQLSKGSSELHKLWHAVTPTNNRIINKSFSLTNILDQDKQVHQNIATFWSLLAPRPSSCGHCIKALPVTNTVSRAGDLGFRQSPLLVLPEELFQGQIPELSHKSQSRVPVSSTEER